MSFSIYNYPDPAAFVRDVATPMAADAIANNVFLIVADQMAETSEPDQLRYGVFKDGACVLAAWMTPPFRLGLADLGLGETAAGALAQHIAHERVPLPGVIGPQRLANAFAAAWTSHFGNQIDHALSEDQHFYRAETVTSSLVAQGSMRLATTADRDLLCGWMAAFAEDAELPPAERGREIAAPRVDRALASNCAYIWEAGGRPAACAIERPFRNAGARITSVFTARDQRGRGYGGAITAALSRQILDSGRWCVLFADAANPLTNRLYQRIGYRLQAVYSDIHFANG